MKNHYLSKTKLVATLIILNVGFVNAQVPFQWKQFFSRPGVFGGGNPETITDIAALSTGSTISIGETSNSGGFNITDIGVIKNSPSGNLLNTYYLDFYGQDVNDKPVKVIVREPYVYVLASIKLNVATLGLEGDIGIIKLDTNLNFIAKSFLGSPLGIDEEAIDMGMDALNNIYIVGSSNRGGSTGIDIVFLKYNQNLVKIFEKYNTSAGARIDVPSAIKVQPSGECNIVGTKSSATNGSQLAVMKYRNDGVLIWQKTYDFAPTTSFADNGRAISYDPSSGDIYAVGSCESTVGNLDWIVLKYTGAAGALSWAYRYTGSGNSDEAIDVTFFSAGSLYVFGNIRSSLGGVTSNNFQVRKINSVTGATVWTKTYDGPANSNFDKGFSMLVTPNERVYMFGTTEEIVGPYRYVSGVVQCINASGTTQWTDLISSGTTSPFQLMESIKGAYNPSTQTLHVATRRIATMSVVRDWVISKYGPTLRPDISFDENASRIGQELNDNNIKIYPNPFTENFIITNDDISNTIFEIYNLEGKLILRKENNFLQNEISTEGWATGTYIVKVIGDNNTIIRKIVKY